MPRRLGSVLILLVAALGLLTLWPALAPKTAPGALLELAARLGQGLPSGPPIRIAVAVDHPGEDGALSSIVKGVRLLAEETNAAGGIGGRSLAVEVHDDAGDPGVGQTIAEWIATETEAVAVIGHRLSAVSAPAGTVYADHRLPAITPTATAPAVTAGNPWYFRTVYSDAFLGRFLALYADTVLAADAAVVALGDQGEGAGLAAAFLEAAGELDLETIGPVVLGAGDAGATTVAEVVARLRELPGRTSMLLALDPEAASPLVRAVREADLAEAVLLGAATLEQERQRGRNDAGADGAGALEGVAMATPVVLDTAAGGAAAFRRDYLQRYGDEPDWRAALAYDAARSVVAAIERSGAAALGVSAADMRIAIRDQLAAMDGMSTGVAGITGPIFFDADGDPPKPPMIAWRQGGETRVALNLETAPAPSAAPGAAPRATADLLLPPEVQAPAFLVAAGILLATAAVAMLRRRRGLPGGLVLVQLVALGVVLVLGQALLLGAIDGRLLPGQRDLLERLLHAAWWLLAGGYLVLVLDRSLWPAVEARAGRAVPAAARRAVTAALVAITLALALAFAFERPLIGVFGALAIVAAFAGAGLLLRVVDPFAALTLSTARPFATGDWVRIGRLPPARVTEMGWQRVRLTDADGYLFSIPNAEVARLPVENFTASEPVSDSITVFTTAEAPPATVLKAIKDALGECGQIERYQGYGATLVGLEVKERMMLMTYRAWYRIADYGRRHQVRQEVWLNIWERLEAEGVGTPAEPEAAEREVEVAPPVQAAPRPA